MQLNIRLPENSEIFNEIRNTRKQHIINQFPLYPYLNNLTEESKQYIIDFMIIKRIKQVKTYILLCEQMGWCIGEHNQQKQPYTLNSNNDITILQYQFERRKVEDRMNKKIRKLTKQQQQIQQIQLQQQQERQKQLEEQQLLEEKQRKQYIREYKLQKIREEIIRNQDISQIIKIEELQLNNKLQQELRPIQLNKVDQSWLTKSRITDQQVQIACDSFSEYLHQELKQFEQLELGHSIQ